jgi:hypothetical protein
MIIAGTLVIQDLLAVFRKVFSELFVFNNIGVAVIESRVPVITRNIHSLEPEVGIESHKERI